MNIEEAAVEVQRRVGLVSARAINCTRVDELVAAERAVMEAVRAGFLAVLDEAKECVVPPSAGWDDEALRERIEELGK